MIWLIFNIIFREQTNVVLSKPMNLFSSVFWELRGYISVEWFSSASTTIEAGVKIFIWLFTAATLNCFYVYCDTLTHSALYNEFSVTCVYCVLRRVVSLRWFF